MAGLTPDFSRYKFVAIARLVKAPWNYKEDDDDKKQKLIASLKRNNQIVNLNVRELDTGFLEVIDGNHRLDALLELGATKAVIYDHGKISLAEAQRKSLEINENQFDPDPIKKANLLAELSLTYPVAELAEALPYTEEEITDQIEMSTFDFSQFGDAKAPEKGEEFETIILSLNDKVYEMWMTWCTRCSEALGYESENKCFEMAVAEALNVPEESLK